MKLNIRTSSVKKRRKCGFLAKKRAPGGRKMLKQRRMKVKIKRLRQLARLRRVRREKRAAQK